MPASSTHPSTKGGGPDITIAGPGKINANGSALARRSWRRPPAGRDGPSHPRYRPVYLQGITVRPQSPFWCVHLIYCGDVSVNGVGIHTRYDEAGKKYPGIVKARAGPHSCRNVFIFNCLIASEDDCIALKSGTTRKAGQWTSDRKRADQQLPVHAWFRRGDGQRDVRRHTQRAGRRLHVQGHVQPREPESNPGRGSVIENITYRDCTSTNRDREVHDSQYCAAASMSTSFMGMPNSDPDKAKPKDDSTPLIRNVLFQNITLETVGGNAIYLTGLPESPLENIRLENVHATGEHGFIANNIRGLVLDHVSVDARDGNAIGSLTCGRIYWHGF